MAQEFYINSKFQSLLTSKKRYKLYYGGRGSGKSNNTARSWIVRMKQPQYFRGIMMREVLGDIRDSQFQELKDVINDHGLADDFRILENMMVIVHKKTGNKIFPKGFKKSSGNQTAKVKSIKDPSHIWIEEADETTEADVIKADTSIRTTKVDHVEIILTFNPEDEDSWINKRWFDDDNNPIEDDDTLINHSTYHDNIENLQESYIRTLESFKTKNYKYYKTYVLGEWGRINVGGEFYKDFEAERHIGKTEYDEFMPLHISFDENVNPYMTCTVWQIKDKHAMQLDEICLESPRNTVKHTCREFIERYRGHTGGLFIYGDRTSIKQDVKLEKGQNFYTLIASELQQFHPKLRLPSANPPVAMRGNFINSIFSEEYDDIKITIGENCVNSIRDYEYLKEGSDGTKHKEKDKHPVTGISFEKYGHCSDANDYMICYAFRDSFTKYKAGGKKFKYRTELSDGIHSKNRYRSGNSNGRIRPNNAKRRR